MHVLKNECKDFYAFLARSRGKTEWISLLKTSSTQYIFINHPVHPRTISRTTKPFNTVSRAKSAIKTSTSYHLKPSEQTPNTTKKRVRLPTNSSTSENEVIKMAQTDNDNEEVMDQEQGKQELLFKYSGTNLLQYSDPIKLKEEIDKYLKDVTIEKAFINRYTGQLCIITGDEASISKITNFTWPKKAFGSQITLTTNKKKIFYMAIHGIHPSTDFDSLKIENCTLKRIFKKSTKQPTNTIQITTDYESTYSKLLKDGKYKFGYSSKITQHSLNHVCSCKCQTSNSNTIDHNISNFTKHLPNYPTINRQQASTNQVAHQPSNNNHYNGLQQPAIPTHNQTFNQYANRQSYTQATSNSLSKHQNNQSTQHYPFQTDLSPQCISLIIDFINNEGIDILCLNETFLKKNASKLDTLQHYNFIRNDRSYPNGGGIGILIKKKFKFKLLHQSNNYNEEVLAISIYNSTINNNLVLIAAYTHPKSRSTFDFVSKLMSNHKYATLLGDLNAHHISWYNKKINKRGYSLMKILDQHNISVINDASQTYKSSKSVIDLIITTEDLLPKTTDVNTNHSYNISDHWPVQINIILKKPVHTTQITNWDTFNNSLAELTHVTQPSINS
ncbi:RNA-directed DNA polymerase from mobile element jockey-like [Brachionus plicatilis]|uniref:RNA-directed DNA polymerase from mobile element jockey-like n=1 Tax=Brachionus plicatilis TaxID=10195 RepID=A0A3M7SAG0_BRAPC|nr:RNA-directed DNA polymerase from mobile element jockey-like [Brachionus plicatilis]